LQRLLPPKEPKLEEPTQALAEVVREVLKSEVNTGNEDHIHESVIGKVERALIGMAWKKNGAIRCVPPGGWESTATP